MTPEGGLLKPAAGPADESLNALAGRLANTAQVLHAWSSAAKDSIGHEVRGRLEAAADYLRLAVAALTDPDGASPLTPQSADAKKAMGIASGDEGVFGLRGRSEMISLVEFVGFLATIGKDGVLQVQTGDEEFVVQLCQGGVVFGTGKNPPGLRLGELLLESGAVTLSALDRARAEAQRDEFLGETLMRLGAVERDRLDAALTEQITQMFGRMHLVGTGFDFQFEEGTKVMFEPDIRLSIAQLLLESARLKDEGLIQANAAAVAAEVEVGESEQHGAADLGQFREKARRLLNAGEVHLPSLPDTTAQLLALSWQPDTDAVQLWECARRDQALCAHVLRVANSVMSAANQPINSVQLAIARLGVTRMREIALALALDQKVFQLPRWERVIRQLWRTAAITGGFAGRISKIAFGSPGEGNLLGLLQDVGKPVVLSVIHDLETRANLRLSRGDAERLMEELHGFTGAKLAREWGLPDRLVAVIEHHHDYDNAGEARPQALVGNLAYELAMWAQAPDDDDVDRLIQLPAARELELAPSVVQSLLDAKDRVLELANMYA